MIHRKRKANARMIEWLCQDYESILYDGSGKMSVIRGKVYDYLGMSLDYTFCGQVRITMPGYIKDILTAFDKADTKGKSTKSSATTNKMFLVDKDCKRLDQVKVVDFQNLVAKTLYATKRAIPDTCTSIAYLTTRIQAPNDKDWDKLVHLMQYIRVTRKLSLTLTVNGSEILKWWVGALFAVHINMRVYSGGGLSLGRGFPIVISTEQKLNTKTFTETEVFGVDYLIPDI